MPRLTVELDEDTFRCLQWRAIGEHRGVRDQASWELERALAGAAASAAPPDDVTHQRKSEAPGYPWQDPAPRGQEKA